MEIERNSEGFGVLYTIGKFIAEKLAGIFIEGNKACPLGYIYILLAGGNKRKIKVKFT